MVIDKNMTALNRLIKSSLNSICPFPYFFQSLTRSPCSINVQEAGPAWDSTKDSVFVIKRESSGCQVEKIWF
jgi:hypothetical protein